MKKQLHMGWLFPLADGTQAEQEAYTALSGLAHTWAKRNTAERVTDALSNELQGERRESFIKL